MRDRGDAISNALVSLLKELRSESGMTMEELAERAAVHRTYIGLLEQGKRQPTVDAASRVANALGARLSNLLAQVEDHIDEVDQDSVDSSSSPSIEIVHSPTRRAISREHFLPEGSAALHTLTGLDIAMIALAIESSYHTLDLVDEQLVGKDTPPISQLVELANLSSMLGNLLGAGIANASQGLYVRNRPHTFPDLLAQRKNIPDLELKTALERNSPKGHLAKAGTYITFRYVLTTADGSYERGREGRGTVATIWEVRCETLSEEDFSISNTTSDSGKTAVIKGASFNAMNLIYYVPGLNPYQRESRVIRNRQR